MIGRIFTIATGGVTPYVLAFALAASAIVGIYLKGRGDAYTAATIKDLKHATQIDASAAAARAAVERGGVPDNDRFRRD
jgi:hypothetical protein